MFSIRLYRGILSYIAYFKGRITIHTSYPDSSLPISTISIDLVSREIEHKWQKSHLVGTELRNDKENTDNNHTDDEKWGIWHLSLKFIENTKCEDNSDDNNA